MLMIFIHNDGTGPENHSNYEYEVRVNDETIERGTLKDHDRADGWRALVSQLIEAKSE